MDRIRIVLHESVVESNLIRIANEQNWWMNERYAGAGPKPTEYICMTRDRLNFIHWTEDHVLGINYIFVKGPQTERIVAILRSRLANYSPAYIMQQAHEPELEPAEREKALFHLAVIKAENGFDQETFDIYCKAMRDPEAYVRNCAVQGCAYLKWPELAEPLRRLASAEEPEQTVRENAAGLLPFLEAPA